MVAQIAGRFFFVLGFILLFFLFMFQAVQAFAEDFHVVQVTKTLQMKESDRIYKDYYINAGKEQGMKAGMIIPVQRRLTIEDNFRKIIDDNVMIDVAKIQLLTVHGKVSIGRMMKVASPKQRGVLEFAAIMTGDKVDIRSAQMGKKGAWLGEQYKESTGPSEVKAAEAIAAQPMAAPVATTAMEKRKPATQQVKANTQVAKKKPVSALPDDESMLNDVPLLTR